MKRPMVSLEPRLISTPMVTSTLQKKPSPTAVRNGIEFLAAATLIADTAKPPPDKFRQPKNAIPAATRMAPQKLPIYTHTQLRSMEPNPVFPSNTEILINTFPVNNSAPVRMTMARPKGNSRPLTIFASPALGMAWDAVLAVAPPMAIRKPASIPSKSILPTGNDAFFTPAWA